MIFNVKVGNRKNNIEQDLNVKNTYNRYPNPDLKKKERN